MTRLYATTPTQETEDFAATPAPAPELAGVNLTSARTARKLIPTTFEAERARWIDLVKNDGKAATWPIEELCAYVPPELWKVLPLLIRDGQDLYVERMRAAISKFGSTPVAPNTKRPNGGPKSRSWVSNHRKAAVALVAPLFELAKTPRFRGLLAGWNGQPIKAEALRPPKVLRSEGVIDDEGVVDTSAPPLRLVRLRLEEFDSAIKNMLGYRDGDDEVELIRRLPDSALTESLERLLRDRVLLTWLPLVGPRAGAFEFLSESCLDFDHRFLDSEVGPAVYVYDPKTATSRVWRWKHLPREFVPILQAYLTIKRRRTSELVFKNWKTQPDSDELDGLGLIRSPPRLVDDGKAPEMSPALFRAPRTLTPIDAAGLRQICSGKRPSSRRNGGGTPALLPRSPDDRYVGFNPNAFRHLHRGLVSSDAALRWCLRHGHDPARRDVWGEMDLDHKLDGLDSLYKDDNSNRGRERGNRLGIRVVWEQLSTPLGLRVRPDYESYETALDAFEVLTDEIQAAEVDFARQIERIERNGADVPVKTVVALFGSHARQRVMERKLTDARQTIMGVESGHEEYLVDIADDVPFDEIPQDDLAHIKQRVRAGVPMGRVHVLRPRRNWLTGEELVKVLAGPRPSTVRGWMQNAVEGRPVPRKAPWAPESLAVFAFSGNRRAAYAPWLRLTPEQLDRCAALIAVDPPDGWNHLPLFVPEPMSAAVAEPVRRLRAA